MNKGDSYVVVQIDMLEGLQHSKLSYSTRSESSSSLHARPIGFGLPSPSHGERGSLAPHSAWEALLNTRLPFLLSEIQAAADFLGLFKASRRESDGSSTSAGN